jgi:hypothetical protein
MENPGKSAALGAATGAAAGFGTQAALGAAGAGKGNRKEGAIEGMKAGLLASKHSKPIDMINPIAAYSVGKRVKESKKSKKKG